MPRQKVPDIQFGQFTLGEIPALFHENKIFINADYQRGDIWKQRQKIELIESIRNSYGIGVLVLYINDNGQFEILDGQQRLLAINQWLNDRLEVEKTNIPKFSEMNEQERYLLNAYCVYYLKLKSYDPESKEEDIIQTFLRLQEGTPLNKAEKISAYRGEFKDTFKSIREEHKVFEYLGVEKRFRWRQLAAELLLIELEGDFERKSFPELDLKSLENAAKKYKKDIPKNHVKSLKANLDFLHSSLNIMLTAFQPRELVAFYLLASYLRRNKAGKDGLANEFHEFAKEFLMNLNSFSIYDLKPPKGMSGKIFNKYKLYKQQSKILTTGESLKSRLEIILEEYQRLHPFIIKDRQRLFDAEQKRTLFFRQKGICPVCNKEMVYGKETSTHHENAHADGGSSNDLENAVLVHINCHKRIEKRVKKHGKESQYELFSKE